MKVSYSALDAAGKKAVDARLEVRLKLFVDAMLRQKYKKGLILIVGDRPGPAAPKQFGYHHTPFYSTKYCSGWLNAALHLAGIPESKLIWLNSADQNGKPTSYDIISQLEPSSIVCLGGNAEKWIQSASRKWDYVKFDHPQYHKRFKNAKEYPLIPWLKSVITYEN